jgi:hypothetical protein
MRAMGGYRQYGFALLTFGALDLCTPALAEWSASLPGLAACTVARPELPTRWRAVTLMMPFYEGQLDVGEFVYDGSLPAMRATVYGLESGAVDLLITNGNTYRLGGPHRAPTACTSLGRLWRVPSADWLSERATCIGRKKLAARAVRWWKTPGSADQATYHWFTAGTRLPWRSLFLRRATDPAVIGDYAMIYYPEFAPLAETDLPRLLDLCGAKPVARGGEASPSIPTARELMGGNEVTEAEREQRINALIPGLHNGGCARMSPVRWPDRFVMTAMLTPIRFDEAPYSSMIYYDWHEAQTQLAIMFQGQGQKPALQGVVSLKNGIGYRVRAGSNGPTCDAVFPGIVRPDWMSAAGCRCRATIDDNPTLSPDAEIQILSCPIKNQDRIMWNWYTVDGRPLVFFEAAPNGGGVMLADYADWLPGATGKPSDFKLPPVCMPANPNAPAHASAAASCVDCHTVGR